MKTLLSDAFYWTDNDLVVQTRSMYGGSPRAKTAAGSSGATFLLDRGGKVSHFAYFANDRSVQAIAAALLDDRPDDFAAIGPLSWSGEDASGTRAALAVARSRGPGGVDDTATAAAQRPAVFVIPGLLGSNLKKGGERIWLAAKFVDALKGLAWSEASDASATADRQRLRRAHRAARRQPRGHRLRLRLAPADRGRSAPPRGRQSARRSRRGSRAASRSASSRLDGRLVARTMALEAPETWQRLTAHDGARLLMLGTPNGGSWSPMQTLSGDDPMGNALAAFGSLFDNRGARDTMAGMPGFLQLQAALLDPALGLDRAATWQKLADDDLARLTEKSLWHDEGMQRTIYQWGAPPQAVLDRAVALRRRLDAQAAELAAAGAKSGDATKMLLVVGRAPFTPGGIVFTGHRPRIRRHSRRRRRPGAAGERTAARRAHLVARCQPRRLAVQDERLRRLSRAARAGRYGAARRPRSCARRRCARAPRRRAAPAGVAPAASVRRAAGPRTAGLPAEPPSSRPTRSRSPADRRPPPVAAARRRGRSTSRCSTPTSGSCTRRSSSATTDRWR